MKTSLNSSTLSVEIVSAKGLQAVIGPQQIQFHVCWAANIERSAMMVIDSTDPAINFSCEFDVSEHDLEDLSATNPATTIYMTSVPLARSDH